MNYYTKLIGAIHNSNEDSEQAARRLGANKELLKLRLMSAREVLTDYWQDQFSNPVFDFYNKRLLSDNGLYAIQWQLREHPDRPESYSNQQTSIGLCYVVIIDKSEDSKEG